MPYIPEYSPPPTSQVIQLFSVRNPPSLHGKDSRPCVVMWLADSSGMHVGRKVSYTCCDYTARRPQGMHYRALLAMTIPAMPVLTLTILDVGRKVSYTAPRPRPTRRPAYS